MTVFIYGLACPISRVIRYIGKSTEPKKRIRNHILAAKRGAYDHHTARWIRSLVRDGLEPKLVIIRAVSEGECWQAVERQCIAAAIADGASLTNATAGGEGLDYVDVEAGAAYRANLSRVMTELWNRPERKAEARQRSVNAWADPEITARRVASIKAANKRPEVQARYRAASLATASRPEVKAARSATMKQAWDDPEYRAIITAARNDPDFVEAQASRLESRWQDDKHRTKMMATRWSDEQRRKQAERLKDPERQAKIKASRSNPETLKRQSESLKKTWARRKAAAAL